MPFTLIDVLYAAAIGAASGSVLTLVMTWRLERRVQR